MKVWPIWCFWCAHLMYCVALVAFFYIYPRATSPEVWSNKHLLVTPAFTEHTSVPPTPYIFRTGCHFSLNASEGNYRLSLFCVTACCLPKSDWDETTWKTWMKTKGMLVSRICREHAAICLDFFLFTHFFCRAKEMSYQPQIFSIWHSRNETQQSAIFLMHLWTTATDSTFKCNNLSVILLWRKGSVSFAQKERGTLLCLHTEYITVIPCSTVRYKNINMDFSWLRWIVFESTWWKELIRLNVSWSVMQGVSTWKLL